MYLKIFDMSIGFLHVDNMFELDLSTMSNNDITWG
jgi:hypothetical protein